MTIEELRVEPDDAPSAGKKWRYRRKKKLERSIEGPARAAAHGLGWVSRKMNGLGFREWPDRLFLPPRRKPTKKRSALTKAYDKIFTARRRFWVEFKRPGKEATAGQDRLHRELRERGETVYVVDDLKDFHEILRKHHAGQA